MAFLFISIAFSLLLPHSWLLLAKAVKTALPEIILQLRYFYLSILGTLLPWGPLLFLFFIFLFAWNLSRNKFSLIKFPANLSSGCSVSGISSFCHSQSPRCVVSHWSECCSGVPVLENRIKQKHSLENRPKIQFHHFCHWAQKFKGTGSVLTFLKWRTGNLLCALSVTQCIGTCITWNSRKIQGLAEK